MQTEKKGITKREKVLLIFMVVMGYTALMVIYVILPLNDNVHDRREDYQEAVIERMFTELLLAAEPNYRERHRISGLTFEDISSRFLNESHHSDIGRMLTQMIIDHGLMPSDLWVLSEIQPEHGSAFLAVSVSTTFHGTYHNLKSLLDTVEEIEYLRVTHLSFNTSYYDVPWQNISISFEVAMIRDRYVPEEDE